MAPLSKRLLLIAPSPFILPGFCTKKSSLAANGKPAGIDPARRYFRLLSGVLFWYMDDDASRWAMGYVKIRNEKVGA